MRACHLLIGAHSFSRSPSSLRLARPNYLLGSGHCGKRVPFRTKFLRFQSRKFHSSPQGLSIKSRWQDAIFGASRDRTGHGNSAHDKYLRSYNAELAQLEHRAPQLHDVLREGHPERILYALLDPISETLFRDASPSFFAATFTLLDPKYFIDPFKEIYRYVKPSLIYGPNEIRIVRALEDQFGALTSQLEEIVERREHAGHTLDLAACKHLLAFAAALADNQMAELVWEHMIPSTKAEPDLDCYAHYMEAFCWAGSWRRDEQNNFRVTSFSMTAREKGGVKGYESYQVGPVIGIRSKMTKMFNTLAKSGLEANEAIFANLMIAMGREGDLEGVKSVLKSVWNIDVDLLAKLDEEEVETPSHYEADSPLRPTSRLLFTIAHVFSINNDVLRGLGMVDFVSRQYDLAIPYLVWFQILEFVYVLSRWSNRSRRERGLGVGYVAETTLEDVWLMCTDEPHNLQPNIPLKVLRSKTLRNRFEFAQALSVFEDCKSQLLDIREDLAISIDELFVKSGDAQAQIKESNQPVDSNSRPESEGYAGPNSSPSFAGPSSSRSVDQGLANSQELGAIPDEEGFLSCNGVRSSTASSENDDTSENSQAPTAVVRSILPAQWLDARRRFILRSLAFERDLQLLIVLARHMLKVSHFPRPARAAFERRFLPQLVENLAEFLPDDIFYHLVKPKFLEDQSRSSVSLKTKAARMEALLKDWTSRRWGKEFDKELFTTTNARLRNLCQVDSHDSLVDVRLRLRPDWLPKISYTGEEETRERDKALTAFMRSPKSSLLDLQNLESGERRLQAKRRFGESRIQRLIQQGVIEPPRGQRRSQPQYPFYSSYKQDKSALSATQSNPDSAGLSNETRFNRQTRSIESLTPNDAFSLEAAKSRASFQPQGDDQAPEIQPPSLAVRMK